MATTCVRSFSPDGNQQFPLRAFEGLSHQRNKGFRTLQGVATNPNGFDKMICVRRQITEHVKHAIGPSHEDSKWGEGRSS